MDLNDYTDVKRVKMLLYGPPKSGKTAQMALLAVAGFKLWVFDLENGIKTLLNPTILAPEFRKNISVFNIPDHRAAPIAIDVVRKILKGGAHKFCYAHGITNCPTCLKVKEAKWSEQIDLNTFTDRDILVIDSLSQLSSSALAKVTLKSWQADPEYKPTFNDFGAQGMYLTEVLSRIQVANINVLMISHEIDIEKDEKKEKIVPIGGTRNFSATVAKYFDEVCYAHVLNRSHKLASGSTWSTTHLTGGRSGVKLEDPGATLSIVDMFKQRKE